MKTISFVALHVPVMISLFLDFLNLKYSFPAGIYWHFKMARGQILAFQEQDRIIIN